MKLAPWGKPAAGWVIAHDPKMSFLGFYQLILAFDVSRRNRPSVRSTKHNTGEKGPRRQNERRFSVDRRYRLRWIDNPPNAAASQPEHRFPE